MYSYDEAFQASLKYFNGDDLSAKVFLDKYALKDNDGNILEKDPQDLHIRLAKEFYRIEKSKFPNKDDEIQDESELDSKWDCALSYQFICKLFHKFKYVVPQGSLLYGIGNHGKYISLSNCVVIPSPYDSILGIYNTNAQIAYLSSRRCGVGWDISKLRPEGLGVQNAAESTSGAVSFMDIFSNTIRSIGQAGRRGASLQSISVHHPDVDKFITAKNDRTKVTGSNISIQFTDEFFKALEANTDYQQRWPVCAEDAEEMGVNYPVISKEASAKKIWDSFIENSYNDAEPGAQYIDTVHRESTSYPYKEFGFKETASNPCLVGSVEVFTPKGKKTLDEINIGDKIWSRDGWTTVLNKWSNGIKPVNKYTLQSGHSIICTKDHKVVSKGIKVEIQNAKTIDAYADLDFIVEGNEISKIEPQEDQEVFDITVDNESHTFMCNGMDISNCGEQFLPPNSCCRLIVLNYTSYVVSPYTKNAYFDFDLFKQHCRILQRLADDVVDLEIECFDRILDKLKQDKDPQHIKDVGIRTIQDLKDTSVQDRRTGCGFTGLADMIAALGYKYGSNKSIEIVEEIQKTFKLQCYRSSVDLAKLLGSFPVYNYELDKTSAFVQRIKQEDSKLYNDMKQYGRRNMTLLTVAPTGSVSCLTQTSSGLEPVFMLEYTRRKKVNHGDKNVKVDFVDQSGDKWQHFTVRHKGLQDYLNINPTSTLEDSPYHKNTANDINWKTRIKLQSVIQTHIDNSLSVTCNLPEDISKEVVSNIYLESWKLGNKGCTIYREGSRTGVLVDSNKTQENKILKNNAPKRPKTLPCEVYQISIKKTPYLVAVGLLNNEPYEVFATQNGEFKSSQMKGSITKLSRKKYKCELEDGTVIEELSNQDEHEETICRLVSTSLRHGVDISYVTHQLEKTPGSMHSFSKSIARALKKYIPDDTKVTGEECPECKGNELVRMEGCVTCKSCGFSKC